MRSVWRNSVLRFVRLRTRRSDGFLSSLARDVNRSARGDPSARGVERRRITRSISARSGIAGQPGERFARHADAGLLEDRERVEHEQLETVERLRLYLLREIDAQSRRAVGCGRTSSRGPDRRTPEEDCERASGLLPCRAERVVMRLPLRSADHALVLFVGQQPPEA